MVSGRTKTVIAPEESEEQDDLSNAIDAGALVVAVRGNYQNLDTSESAGLS